MKEIFKVFLTISFVLLSAEFCSASAEPTVDVGGAGVTSAGVSGFSEETIPQRMQDCQSAARVIPYYCTQSEGLTSAQSELQLADQLSRGNGSKAKTETKNALTNLNLSKLGLFKGQKTCKAAFKRCTSVCNAERTQYAQLAANAVNDPTGYQTFKAQVDQRDQAMKVCKSEAENGTMNMAQVAGLISQAIPALVALGQVLGMGKEDFESAGIDLGDGNTDPYSCEGKYGDDLIACQNGQSNPSSARAGLAGGETKLSGNGSALDGLFSESDAGEPGGESVAGNDSGVGAANFGDSGMSGAFGAASLGSNNAAEEGVAESELNTKINEGNFGGLSSSGGSGSKARPSMKPFSLTPTPGLAGAAANPQLQRNLNKFKSASADSSRRAPASAGKANGPHDENWDVIKQAYKNNIGTLFHQQ